MIETQSNHKLTCHGLENYSVFFIYHVISWIFSTRDKWRIISKSLLTSGKSKPSLVLIIKWGEDVRTVPFSLPGSVFLPCQLYFLRTIREPRAFIFTCINLLYTMPTKWPFRHWLKLSLLRNLLLIQAFSSTLEDSFLPSGRDLFLLLHLLVRDYSHFFPHAYYVLNWPSCLFAWVSLWDGSLLCSAQNRASFWK